MYVRRCSIGVVLLLLACSSDEGDVGLFTADATSDAASADAGTSSSASTGADSQATGDDASTSDTGDASTTATESDSGDTGPLLDIGGAESTGTAEGGDGEGCDFVDLLFVVDNSASMTSYQNALAEAFPGFVDAMFDQLPEGTDLHVGVTTSSFQAGGSHSEANCVAQESTATMLDYYVKPEDGFVNGNGFQGRLVEANGEAYFAADTGVPADRDALKAWFGQAALVGSSGGSFEYNACGAGHAFNPANATANDGFVRDEGAVLMIFILSDEADQSYEVEDKEVLRQYVLDAKSGCGGDECIITGGLLSTWCTPDQSASYDFLASFGEDPVWGPINSGGFGGDPEGYDEVVGAALAEVIEQTCAEIPPVD
jgi:hypothetical protein